MTTPGEGLGSPSLTAQDSRFGLLTIALGYADPKAASIVKGVLDSLGCRSITLVRDGPELLGRTVTEPVDLAVIDWALQTTSGPEALRRLRFHTSHPRRGLPAILLSPDASGEHRRAARDAGADDVVSKPFSARALLSAVYGVIERPRSFVVSPGYAGPDRRSPDRATSAAPGGKEGRTTVPVRLGSIPEAVGQPAGSIAIVEADYSLKRKLGLSVPDTLCPPDDLLTRAEAALASARCDFAREAEEQMAELLSLNRLLIRRPERATGTVASIRRIAAWVEVRSRELGHARIPDVARLLVEYCDRHFVPDNPSSVVLLERHSLTLMAILRLGPEAARGAGGESLVRDLARQVAAFRRG